MQRNGRVMFNKIVSIFMTLLFIALSIPFAFAAETVALSESNITSWPTANGEIYFGQKISDGITLSGGEVKYNDAVVSGHFEFINSSFVPTSTGNQIAALKFVPDNTENYAGFDVQYAWDVLYKVKKTTPILVDENNPPVATDVEAGAKLSTSTISGGQMKNPYNDSESKIAKAVWEWTSGRTVVNESGFYEAELAASGYEIITTMIYVRIAGEVPETSIAENPTANVTYDPNLKWGDVELQGGKAVIKGTETEVPGTFKVSQNWENETVSVRNTKVEVVFTPEDETQALPYTFEIPVTVSPAVPAFSSDDGSGVPTVTVPYGAKLNSSLDVLIKRLVDVDVPVYIAYKDLEGNELEHYNTTPKVGEHEILVRINIDDSNYQSLTMLTYKLVITPLTINPAMRVVDADHYKIVDQDAIAYNAAKPTGTFTVSYTINGEPQPEITTKYGNAFAVDDSRSGEYVFKISYNEVEDDPFVIEDFETTKTEIHDRKANINGELVTYPYGTAVTLVAPATDPAKPDKPYYGFVSWQVVKGSIGLSDEELANTEITFAMPDEDIELKPTYKFSLKLFFEWLWQMIVEFFTNIFNTVANFFETAFAG